MNHVIVTAAKLPAMEIVFVVEKIAKEAGKRITWSTTWGMPAAGEPTRGST